MADLARIRAAATRAEGIVRPTPLLSSPFLDEIAGRRVFVKAECLQHTGSFKFRGAWSALTALPDEVRARGVIAYSSGNHAQGVAYAAQRLGVPAVIVMPQDAPALKLNNTKDLGAEVVTYDRQARESREAIGAAIAEERGLTLIKPYDNPDVMAGQGTTGLEIADALTEDAEVLVCCGGGGLTAGIALALKETHPNAHLTLVGDGEMRPLMEQRIAEAGIADRVTFAGWQDEAGVRAALAQSQALLLPSFAEGLPVVAMEAMAAGRLVIGTYIAGLPELVRQGETGWMVPAGDAEALAEAVGVLADQSPERLAEMAAAARERVLARHDVDIEAAKLAGHIEAVRG